MDRHLSVLCGLVTSMDEVPCGVTLPRSTPDQGPPPRRVEPWTRVEGHQVTRGAEASICGCGGWRGRTDEVNEHLRTAWPVLVPRGHSGTDIRTWVSRVEAALAQAEDHLVTLEASLGIDRPVPPGARFPVLTDEVCAAGARVEVLQHQLDELLARYEPPQNAPGG